MLHTKISKAVWDALLAEAWVQELVVDGRCRALIAEYVASVCLVQALLENITVTTTVLARFQAELISRQMSVGLPRSLYLTYPASAFEGFSGLEEATEETEEAMCEMRERYREAALFFDGFGQYSYQWDSAHSIQIMSKVVRRLNETAYYEFHSGTLTIGRLLLSQPTWVMQEWHC